MTLLTPLPKYYLFFLKVFLTDYLGVGGVPATAHTWRPKDNFVASCLVTFMWLRTEVGSQAFMARVLFNPLNIPSALPSLFNFRNKDLFLII